MRPAIIKQNTTNGLYYVIYPPGAKKTYKCTDQLRIAEMYLNAWNNQTNKTPKKAKK